MEYFASFIGNGVFQGANVVYVHSGMDVQVLPGKAFIRGCYYKSLFKVSPICYNIIKTTTGE